MSDSWLKRMLRWVARMIHHVVRGFIKILPLPLYRVAAKGLYFAVLLIMFPKRAIVFQNLRTAFGREKSKKEIKRIRRDFYRNFGRGLIDFIYLVEHAHLIKDNVRIEGLEHLKNALEQGKGVILTGGHFGNFLLMYWRLALEGYSINVIMRKVHDSAFEDIISEVRTQSHVRAIYDLPPRDCVVQSIKCLRKNELLFILLDQNYGSAGRLFVDFFGQKAATAAGPVVFSLRTKAPILPIFCLKDDGEMKHKILIEPPLELEVGANEEETIYLNVQKITKIIEGFARKYPHEWAGWAHKRWKSKPLHEQEIIDRLKGDKKFLTA